MAALCVFCGSSPGSDGVYVDVAEELGRTMAGAGHDLIYGGGHVGLMGVVADAALEAGGTVTGVMTEQLVAAEVAHRGLSRLELSLEPERRRGAGRQLPARMSRARISLKVTMKSSPV